MRVNYRHMQVIKSMLNVAQYANSLELVALFIIKCLDTPTLLINANN